MAAFAEIAKKVQMETVELMLAAGKDISEDATAAVKKATDRSDRRRQESPPRPPQVRITASDAGSSLPASYPGAGSSEPALSFCCSARGRRLAALHEIPGRTAWPKIAKPLLIKRYASRRLYNTETSDYVTLEDIAGFIRAGREVQIVDLKSGDDLTRQYLLQIIAEHESRGESVLPLDVLTDLVRSYTTQAQSVVPQFLATSFEMLREGQSKMMENMATMAPMARCPASRRCRRSRRPS